MSDTQTPQAAPETKHVGVVARIAMPLFLFSVAFTGLLFVSQQYVLPRFTQLDVTGKPLDPQELAATEKSLQAQVQQLEDRRDQLVSPVHDARYGAIRDEKIKYPSPSDIQGSVAQAAVKTTSDGKGVSIERFSFNSEKGAVQIEGDVSGVGPRSMTVLAQFVENLKALPTVESLTPPSFAREEDDRGDFHSPFSIRFTLRSSSDL